MRRINYVFLFLQFCLFSSQIKTEVIDLTSSNIKGVLESNELVLVDFYASWCYFSNILDPIFTEASNKVDAEYKDKGKIVLAKLDCEKEAEISKKYGIRKYPTMKLFRNGEVNKHEYRGARNVEAFVDYVHQQLVDPLKYVNVDEKIDDKVGNNNLVAYFKSKEDPGFIIFQKIAAQMKDDCNFFVKISPETAEQRLEYATINSPTDQLKNFETKEVVQQWIVSKCTPIVRNITFQNAEDITEEGLPLVLLFYSPNQPDITAQYHKLVVENLMPEKNTVNFVIADGQKFSHPLMHLGKSEADLPLFAIDSFQHMFLLPKSAMEVLQNPEILRKCISDLHSGKLHREFHNGPDPTPKAIEGSQGSKPNKIMKKKNAQTGDQQSKDNDENTTPIPSVFRKLKPNSNRYTLFHDEF